MTFINKAKLGKIAAGAAVATVFAIAMTGPALADRDDHGRGDRDWRMHEQHAWQWHRVHPHPVPVVEPVYAPPVVYAAPPPPPSGINLILPLNFR